MSSSASSPASASRREKSWYWFWPFSSYSSPSSDDSTRPHPYRFGFHPEQSWLDLLLNVLIAFLLPLHQLSQPPVRPLSTAASSSSSFSSSSSPRLTWQRATDDDDDDDDDVVRVSPLILMKQVQSVRKKLSQLTQSASPALVAQWEKALQPPASPSTTGKAAPQPPIRIVQTTCHVPRDLGWLSFYFTHQEKEEALESIVPPLLADKSIPVVLRFPSSLLTPTLRQQMELGGEEAGPGGDLLPPHLSPEQVQILMSGGYHHHPPSPATPDSRSFFSSTSLHPSSSSSSFFPPPFMLHLHGGGFTLGQAADAEGLTLMTALTTASGGRPVMTASVEYGLAPEEPFPAAVVDALSVLSHALEHWLCSSSSIPSTTNNKIHISGVSAGGALALVTALEGMRRYPGRVASVLSCAPFLHPAADTPSYHINGPSSWGTPPLWLRWSWRRYLSLPDDPPLPPHKNATSSSSSTSSSAPPSRHQDQLASRSATGHRPNSNKGFVMMQDGHDSSISQMTESPDMTETEGYDESERPTSDESERSFLSGSSRNRSPAVMELEQANSNRTVWDQSAWTKSPYVRWINPSWAPLPASSKNTATAPHFLVTTNAADPLLDEGRALVQYLQQAGMPVQYLAQPGSHWIGSTTPSAQLQALGRAWCPLVFGRSHSPQGS